MNCWKYSDRQRLLAEAFLKQSTQEDRLPLYRLDTGDHSSYTQAEEKQVLVIAMGIHELLIPPRQKGICPMFGMPQVPL
jgi:hypothetical protein